MAFTHRTYCKTVDINSASPLLRFSEAFSDCFSRCYIDNRKPVIVLCIGTDRSTGDCLGPLVGYKLSAMNVHDHFLIYGTLDEPVHAKNLKEILKEIQQRYTNSFVVAVDASLGSIEKIGYITIAKGPLRPGAGVKKTLPCVGDMHISGVVNFGGFMEYFILQNTRLNLVMKMAGIISSGLYYSFRKSLHEHSAVRLSPVRNKYEGL